MHMVFSIDDSTDSFWPVVPSPESLPSPSQNMADGMTRSQSEWAFQRLLREMSGSDETTNVIDRLPPPVQSNQSLSTIQETADVFEIKRPQQNRNRAGVDADQCHAILKSKLDLACAAVARRVGTVEHEDSNVSSGNLKQSQPQGSVVAQTSPGASSAPSASIQKKQDVLARQTTSVL